ncbi:hypothetical protein ZWY2020_022582 [Hordeum vulgare]|nr:hypothetical protein ZWY2020_022582 [Hordeum vulgare]
MPRQADQAPPASAAVAVEGKPTVFVAEKLAAAGLPLVQEFAIDCSHDLSPEELRAKISLCDALIVRSGTKVGRDVFKASGGRLRVIGRVGVGIDSVDLTAAIEHGCLVVNAPTANTVAAAEHDQRSCRHCEHRPGRHIPQGWQAAAKTNDLAGDGTTTFVILAQGMIAEGVKIVAVGANPVQIARGI